MKKPVRYLTILGIAAAAAFLILPDAYSCHGVLAYRFMPKAQARLEVARLESELAKGKLSLLDFSFPQLDRWIRYYKNPIFQPGPKGSWEEKSVDCFTVGYFQNQYWMWYVGTPNNLNCQMGLATSPDGINWTRHPDNPVLKIGQAGEWDDGILICQHVMFDKEEGIFKMWYVGGSNEGAFGFGYATSPDGAHWTKYAGNPVMVPTQPWEIGTVLEGQTLLKMNGEYKMWYGAISIGSDISNVGYASSPDGIHWTKSTLNPLITPSGGTPLEWDGYSVDTPDVLYDGRIYTMYYRGWRKKSGISYIGKATSPDGIVWTRDPDNPVFVTGNIPGAWDSFQIYRARIFWATGGEDRPAAAVDRLWFTGRDYTLKSQVGLAFMPRRDVVAPKPPGGRIPMRVNQDNLALESAPAPAGGVSLRFFTPWIATVGLKVYDAQGRTVRTLVSEPRLPGFYETAWDGRDDRGRALKPGLYYAELATPGYVMTREVVLVR
jgi:predicted GH43/DUF377 family glycosyl hydrolase